MSTEKQPAVACTLPTEDRPLRQAEFDALFAASVRRVDRRGRTALRLDLDPTPGVAARVADLMVRETGCCSFFAFTLDADHDRLTLTVTVPRAHTAVLAELARRALAA